MLKEMETWQPDDEKVSSSIVPSPDDDDELTMGPKFKVSDIVDVMPRLWAGINKPGGAARITYVNYDQEEDEYTYNVSYIIHSGSEQKVEGIYINKLDQEDGPQKKVRSVRGRCRCVLPLYWYYSYSLSLFIFIITVHF